MKLFVADDVGDAVRAEAARVFQIIIDKIEAVKTPPKITWVKPAAWHMTLRFIGEENGAAVPELCERLAPPVAMTPFEVEWRGVGAFPSPRHPHALAEGDLRRWPVGRARWWTGSLSIAASCPTGGRTILIWSVRH